jgi:hypothetical protein
MLLPVRFPRPGEAGDEAGLDRIASGEGDRDCRGRVLGREHRTIAGRQDQVDLAVDEVGGQGGQPIIAALRKAVFDRQILPLDVAAFA